MEVRGRGASRRRRRRSTTNNTSAAMNSGTARLAIDAPAASMRSTGSASGESITRTLELGAAAPFDALGGTSIASTAGSGSAAAGGSPGALSTSRSRFATNCLRIFADTSAITPLPNCATLPVTCNAVSISTTVPPLSSRITTVIMAVALPWPRVSRPDASIVMVRVPSSTLASFAAPLYCAVIGPTFTFTVPRNSSPAISVSCAPGIDGAMRSMSSNVFHVVSSVVSTRKESLMFSTSWSSLCLACARRRAHCGPGSVLRRSRAPSIAAQGARASRDSIPASIRFRSSSVSTSSGEPVPSHCTSTTPWSRNSCRAPSSPCSSSASGHAARERAARDWRAGLRM